MPLYSQDQINTIAAKIKHIRFGMFTTMDHANVLSSRPLTVQQIDGEGNMWFFSSDEADYTQELTLHPEVNVSFSSPDEHLYLSVTGQAFLVRDRAKARELWNPLVRAWYPGGLDDPHLTLIRVRIQTAEYWDASTSKMKQLVQLARTAVTGRAPVGMGKHTTICL
ncbi:MULTISPECIES: pyridoxamine 5'-phosphate oxidase family protein [unclassified Duganella]|jgi:general stress protein 26|uniref:pyridoxamine 5'-phosphate oxidase family protein n=1 Tax=unclassified Duganella TaxID=2636909 RepID=UPI00088325E8|nr:MULTISPECIES: pyridoxamine 5'-phosphate oxidase family protein [unclassified Duganella]SDF38989.1 General stress protein 26 [Duganella sp. OV458]SDI87525.1 General stress protein 26 [Duganella sp. OV510]